MKGDIDTMLILDYVDDVVHVRCEKQRNGPKFDTLSLKPVPEAGGGMVLRLAKDVLPSASLTPTQTALLDCLRDICGADGVTKPQWREASKGICNDRTFYKVATVLEERGHVAKVGNSFRVGAKR